MQVEDNSYTVKIEEMSSQKEQAETAEDIAYSAFLSEYDHCVQRSEKLDNKVYILLTVCAFLFVLLIEKVDFKTRFTLKWFHDIIIFINNEFVEPFFIDLWRCRNDGKEKTANRNRYF